MHRKLFNMGGGGQLCQLQYLWRDIAKMYIHACMRTHINIHMKTHVHAPKCSYSHACMHACTHICMHACTCRYIKTFIYIHYYMKIKASALYDIEFRKSDASPGRTEVKQGKFVKYIFLAKGYFRETNTVNSEIFTRFLYSRNFAYAKFLEYKTIAKCPNYSVVY